MDSLTGSTRSRFEVLQRGRTLRSVSLRLPSPLEAVSAARKALASLNAELHLISEARLFDAQLVTSELVTNAVGATRQDWFTSVCVPATRSCAWKSRARDRSILQSSRARARDVPAAGGCGSSTCSHAAGVWARGQRAWRSGLRSTGRPPRRSSRSA